VVVLPSIIGTLPINDEEGNYSRLPLRTQWTQRGSPWQL